MELSSDRNAKKLNMGLEERYKRLFDEAMEPIFVLDSSGYFIDLNKAGLRLFKYSSKELLRVNLFELFCENGQAELFIKEIERLGYVHNFKVKLITQVNICSPCVISAHLVKQGKRGIARIQGSIRDISEERAQENREIRLIIDTQEKERKKLAIDMHESLGQQLSAVKFYLATIKKCGIAGSPLELDSLSKSNAAIDHALIELGNICFNLMPGTLYAFGLRQALRELCKKMEMNFHVRFALKIDDNVVHLKKQLEVDVFRIIEEFIHNSVRHGQAKKVSIEINHLLSAQHSEFLFIKLTDDGGGFIPSDLFNSSGTGLRSVKSRIASYNGVFALESAPGDGTRCAIQIPLAVYNSSMQEEK